MSTICIEVKQSKQDYKNGFVSAADLNYIIAPKGLLDPSEMLKGVGLIEVDFDNLRMSNRMEILSGATTVKKATRQNNKVNQLRVLKEIACRNTIELLF